MNLGKELKEAHETHQGLMIPFTKGIPNALTKWRRKHGRDVQGKKIGRYYRITFHDRIKYKVK